MSLPLIDAKALIKEVTRDQRLTYSARIVCIWLILNAENQWSVTAADVAQTLPMDKSTATLSLSRLQAAEYVTAGPSNTNRDQYSLTAAIRNRAVDEATACAS
jgi:hypothetical protein